MSAEFAESELIIQGEMSLGERPVEASEFSMLADRYRDLGLVAAARDLLERLVPDDCVGVEALARLAVLDLEAGALADARRRCHAALRRVNEDTARRADLEILGAEIAWARGDVAEVERFSEAFMRHVGPSQRWRGQLLGASMALARDDAAGAEGMVDELLRGDLGVIAIDHLEELARLASATGGAARWREALHASSGVSARYLEALILAEDAEADGAEIEGLLEEAGHGIPEARLTLALRLAGRRRRDPVARAEAVAIFEGLVATPSSIAASARARVELLLASLYDDDLAGVEVAEASYRRALPELPRDGTACNNLGVIVLGQGAVADAESWFLRALIADPDHRTASRNLARVLYVEGASRELDAVISRLEAMGGSPELISRLCLDLVEVAREDAREGIATKGHQLKNLIGVVGTRLRRLARENDGPLGERLNALHQRIASIYDEWAAVLRALREEIVAVDTIDLNVVANEAMRIVGVPVRLSLAEGALEVSGLRGQLIEAVVNLLRNAIEAAGDDGGVRVETRRAASGRLVYLDVIDTGPGIARADLRRVLHVGYTTKRDGSGLGLSIAERIVQDHGGRLEINSRRGEGTRVRIELPVHLESETRRGMLRAPSARVLRAARAEEYVIED